MEYAMLSVPLQREMKKQMEEHSEIKWVEVARQAIAQRLLVLEKMDQLLAKSEFSHEDTLRHGREIKKSAWKKTQVK